MRLTERRKQKTVETKPWSNLSQHAYICVSNSSHTLQHRRAMHQPLQTRIVGRQAPHQQRRFFTAATANATAAATATAAARCCLSASLKNLRTQRLAFLVARQFVGDLTQHALLVGGGSRPANLCVGERDIEWLGCRF
jgi:hypothetical protein